jgi:hypothetical protein
MSLEGLFSAASTAVMPGWLLLLFAPRWPWTARFVAPVLIPVLLGVLYLYLIVTRFPGAEGGFGSLADVRRLFGDDALLLAGWVHYLAFDLFIGSFEVRDAQSLRVPHLLVAPCLVLTFLFGPVGLLLYLGLRGALRHKLLVDDDGGLPSR